MKFLKSNAYTALNADDSLIGATGYFADSLDLLTLRVERENKLDLKTVVDIKDGFFITERDRFNFFYLSQEAGYRPFNDTDELIKVYKQKLVEKYKTSVEWTDIERPCIWVKDKVGCEFMINSINHNKLSVDMNDYARVVTMPMLFCNFTFIDGSPCGVKVE